MTTHQITETAAARAAGAQRRLRLLALVPSDQPVPYVEPVDEALSVHTGDTDWFLRNIPCQAACPLGTDVPGYVASIADGDFATALAINRDANLLPSVLCHICSRPCEVVCRRALLDAPIAVRALKRAAVAYASDGVGGASAPPSGHRIAVIGSGPAGLAAAHDLATQGHKVTVLERAAIPGGMLALGIPPFRLPREAVEQEVQLLEAAGVQFHCNTEIGRDVSLAELEQAYDAVLLAAGCQSSVRLDLPGEELSGVYDALTFMERACLGQPLPVGERLVVIGAGAVGLDCARTGLRLGARRVAVFDLAAREEMAYDPRELAEAEEEGVQATFRVRLTRFLGAGCHVCAVEFVPVIAGPGRNGDTPSLRPSACSPLTVEADAVVLAVSQRPDLSWLAGSELGQASNGALAVDTRSGRVGETKLFAAGDFVSGPGFVSDAIAAGRRAATGIHQFLTNSPPPTLAARFELVTQMEAPFGFQQDVTEELNRRASDWTPRPGETSFRRVERPSARWTEGTARRRASGGDEFERRPALEPPHAGRAPTDLQQPVEEVFAPASAIAEAQRCLQCQLNVFIEASACTLCGGCVNACPYEALAMVAAKDIASVEDDELNEAQRRPFDAAIVLDEDRCTRCGVCLARCPTRAITLQQFRLVPARGAAAVG